MKAMILAAGRGERMRPLSDERPKPLLAAGGKPLIVHLIESLARGGCDDLVINHAHLGAMLERELGDGSRYGVRIQYSPEPGGALDTGGGILKALPLLGDSPFIAINGDLWTALPLAGLAARTERLNSTGTLAHLVLVPNPDFHPRGDFYLLDELVRPGDTEMASAGAASRFTFAGIGLYAPALFERVGRLPSGAVHRCEVTGAHRFSLAALLVDAMRDELVTGELYEGSWFNVGTPAQLEALDRRLSGDGLPIEGI